jgi:diguanylate cyclase (GGDEF)-like protein/PAS domain S-box-containing protein
MAQRFFLFCWLILAGGFSPALLAFHAESVRIDPTLKQQTLFPNLYYQQVDPTVGVEDIVFEPARLHAFVPLNQPNEVLRSYPEAVWFLARLHYNGQRPGTVVLNYESINADRVEFYLYDRQSHELSLVNRAGTDFPFSERMLQARSFAVQLSFKADQELDLLVKVQDGAIIPSNLQLFSVDEFGAQLLQRQISDGLILGVLFVMALYNAMLYLNVREALYCHFSGFFFSFALLVAILNGAGFAMMWPEYPELNPSIFYVTSGACMVFLTLLTHAIVQNPQRWLLWLNLASSAALLFTPLYAPRSLELDVLLVVICQVMLTNLFQAIRYGFSGLPLARTFAIGWLLFFVASAVLLLTEFGYLDQLHLWQWLLVLSVICSMLLMSYSLAQRLQSASEQSAKEHEHTIRSLQQFHDIYHNAVEGLFSTTLDGKLLSANRALLNILGYQELSQMEVDVQKYGMGRYYANPDDRLQMVRQLQHLSNQSFELRGLRADNTPFWALMSARLTRNSQGEAFIHGSLIDITERKVAHEQLAYLASHDPLTGLYNRHHFIQLAQQAWQRRQLDQQTSALLFIDIDQFKLVNTTCDHAAGDALLKQISDQLKRALGQTGLLARIGGDEFGVLLPGKTAHEAFSVAYSLLDVVKEFRFFWQDSLFSISVSIGLTDITLDDLSAEHALKKADSACFVAKEKGRNRIHLYNADDQELQKHQAEIHWLQVLRQALEQDKFVLYMQPIQAIQQRDSLAHYELLLRLVGEDESIIAPGNFLSSAERYGLMPQIDRWVVRSYFRWLAQHPQHLTTLGLASINLSGASLIDPLFKAFVQGLLDEYQIPARHICFEITESMAILNLQNTLEFIHHFRGLGCHFALDDFGSGFSSYGYLKNFPVDFVKIDGNFVRDLLDDKYDRAIVNSIHDVATAMGIQTIAEFVENQDILLELKRMGVNYAQGYGVAKPKPLADIQA